LSQYWPAIAQELVLFRMGLKGDRLLLLAWTLLGIKGMHELGHAMACQTIGGRCREIGVLFFLGMPCLYCDVTDIWRIPNRWKRILVSAAGMYVEIIIAIIAGLLWFLSDVPWIKGFSVQVMLLCSVTTLLFNGNPLLRLDGYHLLSDWLKTPNLLDQARDSWLRLWKSMFLRIGDFSFGLSDFLLICYFGLSWFYRWFLMTLLIWGTSEWLLDRRLGHFGLVIGAAILCVILSNVISTTSTLAGLIANPRLRGSVRWVRVGMFAFVLLVCGWLFAAWRLPHSIYARGIVEPQHFVPIYIRHPSLLGFSILPGTQIENGQLISELASPEMEFELLQLKGEEGQTKVRLQQIAKRSVDDPLAAQQEAELERTLTGLQQRRSKLASEIATLTIRSPGGGRWFETTPETRTDVSGKRFGDRIRLNQIAVDRPSLDRGSLLGRLVDSDQWIVRAFVSEREISRCAVGAKVRLRLDQRSRKTWKGKVISISEENLEQTPESLQGDPLFASNMLQSSSPKPEQTTYSVLIHVDLFDQIISSDGLATVCIESEPKTLLERCLFHFGPKLQNSLQRK